MPRSKINKKMLRGLEFNSDVVKTKTEEEFVNICLGYAEDEKCTGYLPYKNVSEAQMKKDYALFVPKEKKEKKEKVK